MKILAHYILYNKKIYRNSIVEIADNRVNISSFEDEIANTEFHNGIILVSKKDYSESIEHFSFLVKQFESISDAVVKIAEELDNDGKDGIYHLEKIYF